MTTFTTAVAASSDDAQETSGTVNLTATVLNANSTAQITALRFAGVTVPPGSTINSAYLTINITSTTYDDPDVTVRSSGEANPATFNTDAGHVTNRAKSAAFVSWIASNIGAGARNSPDLAALVAETITLPGWASGNAIAFYLTGNSGASSIRCAGYDSGSNYPQLTIDYTAPSAGGQPRRTMHQFRLRG
jgi:hypothetical protein